MCHLPSLKPRANLVIVRAVQFKDAMEMIGILLSRGRLLENVTSEQFFYSETTLLLK